MEALPPPLRRCSLNGLKLSALVFILCWTAGSVSAENCSPPNFYTSLPRDRDWFYGVARDSDTDRARDAAVRNLGKQVSGGIEGWDEKQAAAIARHGRDRASADKAVDAVLIKTPLAGWEQDDFVRCSGYSYVLVRIQKEKARAFFRENKILEKTIIVIEGGKTFKDPKDCKRHLSDYASQRGELDETSARRVDILARAEKSCAQLDPRDVPLQTELLQKLWMAAQARKSTIAVYLSQRLSKESTVEGRLAALRLAEQAKLGSQGQAEGLRRLMLEHFDALSRPFGDLSQTQGRQAGALTMLVTRWPSSLAQELKVCAMRRESTADDHDSEVCFSLSHLSLRAQWATALCCLQVPKEQSCTMELMKAAEEACPDRVDRACFQRASALVKEATGAELSWIDPFPRADLSKEK